MVLEYADDSTLFEKIKTTPLSKALIKSYFKDVCEAIAYLHKKEIMHRDIKVRIKLDSHKIFCWQNWNKPNYVISGLQQSSNNERLSVVLMNICLHKWFKTNPMISKLTFGHWAFFSSKWSRDKLPLEEKVLSRFSNRWKPKYSFVKILVFFKLYLI